MKIYPIARFTDKTEGLVQEVRIMKVLMTQLGRHCEAGELALKQHQSIIGEVKEKYGIKTMCAIDLGKDKKSVEIIVFDINSNKPGELNVVKIDEDDNYYLEVSQEVFTNALENNLNNCKNCDLVGVCGAHTNKDNILTVEVEGGEFILAKSTCKRHLRMLASALCTNELTGAYIQ